MLLSELWQFLICCYQNDKLKISLACDFWAHWQLGKIPWFYHNALSQVILNVCIIQIPPLVIKWKQRFQRIQYLQL